jgi:hypothetical protein
MTSKTPKSGQSRTALATSVSKTRRPNFSLACLLARGRKIDPSRVPTGALSPPQEKPVSAANVQKTAEPDSLSFQQPVNALPAVPALDRFEPDMVLEPVEVVAFRVKPRQLPGLRSGRAENGTAGTALTVAKVV